MEEPPPPTSPATEVLEYAPPSSARRAWRWVRPGSAGFFLLVLALVAGGTWGGWKWMLLCDRRAFEACTTGRPGADLMFVHAPSRGALRHLARQPGAYYVITLGYPAAEFPAAEQAFANVPLPHITLVRAGEQVDVKALLKQFSRPDGGLKAVTTLDLSNTQVTDAELEGLARPDSGLGRLGTLGLHNTQITDEGLKKLARPDSVLQALTVLYLDQTQVTDAGLKELGRPDSGLKALTELYLVNTQVTDSGIAELRQARPGLKISR